MKIIEIAGKKLQFSDSGAAMGRTWDTFHKVKDDLEYLEEGYTNTGSSGMYSSLDAPHDDYKAPSGETIRLVHSTWTTDARLFLADC